MRFSPQNVKWPNKAFEKKFEKVYKTFKNPLGRKIMKGYYIDNDADKETFHSIKEYLMRKDFLSILIDVCERIIEKGEDLLKPSEKEVLSDTLFTILNIKPKADEFQFSYDNLKGKMGKGHALRNAVYQRIYTKELRRLYPLVTKLPITYQSVEIRIAEMHFSGALGLFDGMLNYGEEASPTESWFSFNAYKQIRAASTVDELVPINTETELALVYILTGYYIGWYADLLERVIEDAGFGIPVEKTRFPQKKLESILSILQTDEEYKAFLPTTTGVVPTRYKKDLLTPYCHKNIILNVIKLLNDIGEDFKIGYKICSKKQFAQIAWMVKEYCRVIRTSKYKTCKDLLTKYYGVPPTQYKVKDCSDFLKKDKGQKLKKKLVDFSAEYERYCRM